MLNSYRVTSSVKEIERLNKADFALFSATWWPMASLEAAHILTCVAIWVNCPLIIS